MKFYFADIASKTISAALAQLDAAGGASEYSRFPLLYRSGRLPLENLPIIMNEKRGTKPVRSKIENRRNARRS